MNGLLFTTFDKWCNNSSTVTVPRHLTHVVLISKLKVYFEFWNEKISIVMVERLAISELFSVISK